MSEYTKCNAKLHVREMNPNKKMYLFYCEGCDDVHIFHVGSDWGDQHNWGFNGNLDCPSFTPSLLMRWKWGEEQVERVCHLVLTDGKINYCGDCTHKLAGQTVDMPNMLDWKYD